jgi:putative SOS response-associated peptidase YedK
MCGRYVSSSSPQAIAEQFGALLDPGLADSPLHASWNVAPTNSVYTVVADDDTPSIARAHVRTMHWGLVPHWAKDAKGAGRMINARAETLLEKPTFKGLVGSRRCIVPMDGFYEWRTDNSSPKPVKQPFFIHSVDGRPLAAAGLWTVWRDKTAGDEAPELRSVTIITTGANATMSGLHDRMPVFLTADEWAAWLDPQHRDPTKLIDLLDPAPDDVLVMHPVSRDVNSVRNKGAHLIEPVDVVDGVGELGASGDLWSAG